MQWRPGSALPRTSRGWHDTDEKRIPAFTTAEGGEDGKVVRTGLSLCHGSMLDYTGLTDADPSWFAERLVNGSPPTIPTSTVCTLQHWAGADRLSKNNRSHRIFAVTAEPPSEPPLGDTGRGAQCPKRSRETRNFHDKYGPLFLTIVKPYQ